MKGEEGKGDAKRKGGREREKRGQVYRGRKDEEGGNLEKKRG